MRLLKHNKAVRLKARRVGAENKPRERLSQQQPRSKLNRLCYANVFSSSLRTVASTYLCKIVYLLTFL